MATLEIKFGIYGLGEINQDSIYNKYKSGVNGWRFRPEWEAFETSRGVFNNNEVRSRALKVIADGKFVTFGEMPGPDPNTPPYLYGNPDLVPRIYTDRGVYPYGDSDAYKDRLRNMWGALKAAFETLDPETELPYVVAIQIAELSTGDPGTTKGTISKVTINNVAQPNPSSYFIRDYDWFLIKRAELWPYAVTQTPGRAKAYFNVSSDGANFDHVRTNYPSAWLKIGYPTHNYDIPGEVFQKAMCDATKYAADDEARFEAEFDAVNKLQWYQQSPKRNLRSIIVSACAHGMDIMNISLGDMNSVFGNDLTLMNWANKYYGYRLASKTNKGFIVFRRCIDIANINEFPEDATYKPVIDPNLLSSYTKEVQRIQNNVGLTSTQKNYTITKTKISYLNPARIAALRAKFPDALYATPDQDQDHDAYNNDYGVDMIPGNYEKHAYVLNYTTLKYYWRVGPVDSFYGRFGAGFDIPNNVKRIYCTEDFTNNYSYQITILVRYLEKGTGSFSLRYFNGTSEAIAGLVSTTNTNTWKEKTFSIPNYVGGKRLENGADFIINYETGAQDYVIFDGVEIEVVAINNPTNQPPKANAGEDQQTTDPVNYVTLNGLGSDVDGNIVGYFWQKIDGPASGVITNPTAQNTTFTSLTPGEYTVQLTVTDDDGDTGSDTAVMTVKPGTPNAEITSTTDTITLPTSGLAVNAYNSTATSGTITGYLWELVSGPISIGISTPNAAQTNLTGMNVSGVYTIKLTVTNSYGVSNSTTKSITVQNEIPVNKPPVSIPGADQILTGQTSTVLNGSGTDQDGTIVSYFWEKLAGPSGGSIVSPNSASTNITGLQVTTADNPYIYQLTVTDNNGASDSKSLTIAVNQSSNLDPVPIPGENKTIQLPVNYVSLDGSASYDPDGSITGSLWDQKKGPKAATITSPNALVTDVTGLDEPGDYVFKLRVQDNDGNIKGATVTVSVLAPNNPPIVEITTQDQTIQLPEDSINVYASVSDADGSVTTILWTQTKGDAATIESPSSPNTVISDLKAGINVFRLYAADDLGATNYKELTLVVNSAEVEENYVKGAEITDFESYELDGGIVALKTLPFAVLEDYKSAGRVTASITLQFIDSRTGTFYVNCIRCTNRARRALAVKLTGSGDTKTVTATVNDFRFGETLDFGADFNITDAEGIKFILISFTNNNLLD